MEKLPLKIERVSRNLFDEASSTTGHSTSSTRSSGEFTKLANESEGLAKSDPGKLLHKFDLSGFDSSRFRSKPLVIAGFLSRAFSSSVEGEPWFKWVFEDPAVTGNKITVKVIVYEVEEEGETTKLQATSQINCRKFINSLLLAGARLNKIQWNDASDECVARFDSGHPRVEITVR